MALTRRPIRASAFGATQGRYTSYGRDLMGMTAGNFRRPHVEGALLFDLAVELYRPSAA